MIDNSGKSLFSDKMVQGTRCAYSKEYYTVIGDEIVNNKTHRTVDYIKR